MSSSEAYQLWHFLFLTSCLSEQAHLKTTAELIAGTRSDRVHSSTSMDISRSIGRSSGRDSAVSGSQKMLPPWRLFAIKGERPKSLLELAKSNYIECSPMEHHSYTAEVYMQPVESEWLPPTLETIIAEIEKALKEDESKCPIIIGKGASEKLFEEVLGSDKLPRGVKLAYREDGPHIEIIQLQSSATHDGSAREVSQQVNNASGDSMLDHGEANVLNHNTRQKGFKPDGWWSRRKGSDSSDELDERRHWPYRPHLDQIEEDEDVATLALEVTDSQPVHDVEVKVQQYFQHQRFRAVVVINIEQPGGMGTAPTQLEALVYHAGIEWRRNPIRRMNFTHVTDTSPNTQRYLYLDANYILHKSPPNLLMETNASGQMVGKMWPIDLFRLKQKILRNVRVDAKQNQEMRMLDRMGSLHRLYIVENLPGV